MSHLDFLAFRNFRGSMIFPFLPFPIALFQCIGCAARKGRRMNVHFHKSYGLFALNPTADKWVISVSSGKYQKNPPLGSGASNRLSLLRKQFVIPAAVEFFCRSSCLCLSFVISNGGANGLSECAPGSY